METMSVSRVVIRSPLGLFTQGVQWKAGSPHWRGFRNISETMEEADQSSPQPFLQCALRGLKEELGLAIEADRLESGPFFQEVKPSPTTGEVKEYRFKDWAVTITLSEALCLPLVIHEGDSVTFCYWS